MILKDFWHAITDFWEEFHKDKSGLVGIALLSISLLVVIFEPVILPWKDTNTKWRSIDYWIDNSPSAPPAWTNWFTKHKSPVTMQLTNPKRVASDLDNGGKMIRFEFPYRFEAEKAPLDVIFHASITGDVPINFTLERPDGTILDLTSHFEQGLSGQDIRVSMNNEAHDSAFAFLKTHESEQALEDMDSSSQDVTHTLFNIAKPGMASHFEALKGTYTIVATAMVMDPANAKIEKPRVVVTGSVSGILGTDDMKRDIFSGLIAGVKWALLIGILTSAISVLVGVLYGIISAYYGGVVDGVMQFIFQIVNSMPVLPVLIVVSAIFKPSIWFMIIVMVLFFWTGSVMTVRSMAFQIKEETYIESAKALGASNRRIIWRHMFPILVPYSFASMALSVPAAIVYESTVSLLGLGDATIVTWGQILHDAMAGGAVLNGVWWWIIPPGLLIAVMGMTFAFIGFAMDKILQPKLQTR
jgi:peptide/nickel transport system permease protein